jgi:glycosyltransferase involved in cell wall biosynthesis
MSKVVAAGTFDREFGRNRRLIAMLERSGHEVAICQTDVFGPTRYDVLDQRKSILIAKGLVAYPRLVWRFLRIPRADVVLVLYPGWFDAIVLGLVSRVRRVPVVFDIYISLFDTIVVDRKIASESSIVGRLSRVIDWLSIRSANRVLADTPDNADLYARLGGIPRDRIGVVWVGAEDGAFGPRPEIDPDPKRVLFYGTFIKLHGVDVIVRAAKLLEADGIEFRIIGTGQELDDIRRLVARLDASNVEMVGRIPLRDLAGEIASATVCCGIFGTSDKARRVVPNKVFECIRVGRAVVTGDTPAMRRAFSEEEVAMVPPGDPEALAREIRALLSDPVRREAMAEAAHRHYLAEYTEESLTQLLETELQTAIQAGHRSRRRDCRSRRH